MNGGYVAILGRGKFHFRWKKSLHSDFAAGEMVDRISLRRDRKDRKIGMRSGKCMTKAKGGHPQWRMTVKVQHMRRGIASHIVLAPKNGCRITIEVRSQGEKKTIEIIRIKLPRSN